MSSYDTHAQKLGAIALATEYSAVSEATVMLLARAGRRNSEAGRPTYLLCAVRLRGPGLLQGPTSPWYRIQMPHLQGKGTPRTLVLRSTFRKQIVAMCIPVLCPPFYFPKLPDKQHQKLGTLTLISCLCPSLWTDELNDNLLCSAVLNCI